MKNDTFLKARTAHFQTVRGGVPVAAIISYDTVEETIEIANDSPFGLAGYVHGSDQQAAQKVAGQIRAGMVRVNSIEGDLASPWGELQAVRYRPGVGRHGYWRIS